MIGKLKSMPLITDCEENINDISARVTGPAKQTALLRYIMGSHALLCVFLVAIGEGCVTKRFLVETMQGETQTVISTLSSTQESIMNTVASSEKRSNEALTKLEQDSRSTLDATREGINNKTTAHAEGVKRVIDSARESILGAVDSSEKRGNEALTRLEQDTRSALESARADINRTATTHTEEVKGVVDSARVDILKCFAKDAPPAGNSAAVSSKQAAAGQRALELGNESLASGKTELALLYYINGLNHDPSRMELVQKLADAALKCDSIELADRAVGVLELTTMQVAPDDMSAVLDKIVLIREKIAPPTVPTLSPEEAVAHIEKLMQTYAPEKVWNTTDMILDGLSQIEQFEQILEFSRVDVNDERFQTSINQSRVLGEALRRVQSFLPMYQHVTLCISLLEALADSGMDGGRFASISASAQGVLSQIWGGIEVLPVGMRETINDFPERIGKAETKMQEKLSLAPYISIETKINMAISRSTGTYTERINLIANALEEAGVLADKIIADSFKDKFHGLIMKARDKQVELDIQRRAAYQEWAAKQVHGFMAEWNKLKSVSDDEAKQFFANYQIDQIDETLIIPEVARILGRVMTCMTGELNAKDGAAVEHQMATATKKQMEDF